MDVQERNVANVGRYTWDARIVRSGMTPKVVYIDVKKSMSPSTPRSSTQVVKPTVGSSPSPFYHNKRTPLDMERIQHMWCFAFMGHMESALATLTLSTSPPHILRAHHEASDPRARRGSLEARALVDPALTCLSRRHLMKSTRTYTHSPHSTRSASLFEERCRSSIVGSMCGSHKCVSCVITALLPRGVQLHTPRGRALA